MKRNVNHRQPKRSQGGFTLIEISLVIALILGLITVAFMGISAYRKGSDKAKCKLQISQVQKAVRATQNMQELAVGGTFGTAPVPALFAAVSGIIPVATPYACPDAPTGTLVWSATIPALGTPVGNCSGTPAPYSHVLSVAETAEW